MRAIFMGTPEIAVPAFEALSSDFEVVGVVCQPDRPAGRGLQQKAPPVKTHAVDRGIEVVQPAKIRTDDFLGWVKQKKPDFVVVMAYGRIVPSTVLEVPEYGCLNLHASILPRYRGAAPIQWAIIRGETQTGISLMRMEAGLDTGPVYATRTLAIGEDETAEGLAARLAALGAEVVHQDLPRVLDHTLSPLPQRHDQATLAPILKKEDGTIDWNLDAKRIHDHVRGMYPWPGAFTRIGSRTLKVLKTRPSALSEVEPARPGTVIAADSNGALVACGGGVLEVVRAQLEGRRALSGAELVQGRTLQIGMTLG